MDQGIGLNQVQAQRLQLTAELRQALAVLQLPVAELTVFVNQQLQENPLLETDDAAGAQEDPASQDTREPDWDPGAGDAGERGEWTAVRDDDRLERVPAMEESLADHLLAQVRLMTLEPRERRIAVYLIGCLDEDGYLRATTTAVARHLCVPVGVVESVLALVQRLEPPGVAARDPAECLRLQLARRGIRDRLLDLLIGGHLADLAAGRMVKVARALGVSVEQVQTTWRLLRTLEPHPGRGFSRGEGAVFLVPDVIMQKVEAEYVVLVNEWQMPHLTVNHTYQRLLGEGDPETRRFISARLAAARWLIKNIEQRRLTLLKVCQVLVERQRGFLDRGREYLKPLTMKEVAGDLECHESTVSRAVANKYVQTPQGLLPLKYFFASGTSRTASEAAKSMIAALIRAEEPCRPLSDARIAEILAAQGVDLSRRTVAKYRDELGILPAARRKMEG